MEGRREGGRKEGRKKLVMLFLLSQYDLDNIPSRK